MAYHWLEGAWLRITAGLGLYLLSVRVVTFIPPPPSVRKVTGSPNSFAPTISKNPPGKPYRTAFLLPNHIPAVDEETRNHKEKQLPLSDHAS